MGMAIDAFTMLFLPNPHSYRRCRPRTHVTTELQYVIPGTLEVAGQSGQSMEEMEDL